MQKLDKYESQAFASNLNFKYPILFTVSKSITFVIVSFIYLDDNAFNVYQNGYCNKLIIIVLAIDLIKIC